MDETIVWDPYKTSRQPPITDHFSVRSYCSKPSNVTKEKDNIKPSRKQTFIPKYLCRRVKKSRYQDEVDAAFALIEKSIAESKNLNDAINSFNDVALPTCGKYSEPCIEYLEDSSASNSSRTDSMTISDHLEKTDEEIGVVLLDCDESSLVAASDVCESLHYGIINN